MRGSAPPLFERCRVDAVLGFDNRERLFPVHRGLRFSVITATKAGATPELQARFAMHAAAELESVPDTGEVPGTLRIPLTSDAAILGRRPVGPEIECARDRAILARILAVAPALGSRRRVGRRVSAAS